MTDRYLGRYRLLRQIGSGGMAVVYHAVQEGPHGFDQEVAIKLIHPQLLAEHPHVLQMLVDEARIAARIKHLNVVRILDLCQDPAGFYLVMDYVDGLSMRDVLDASRQLQRPAPLAPVLDVLAQACDGLHAAHELTHKDGTPLGLVHRDVKPGNLLIGSEGDVKVADFGIALFADRNADATSHGQMKGTPAYIAPEQAIGGSVDRRADIFSMGLTLYTMATTELAFTGDTGTAVALKITQESLEPHAERLDALAPGLGDVLRDACGKDPQGRFSTAQEMAAALRGVREMLPDTTSVAEMLAGAGWRPWDRQEGAIADVALPTAVEAEAGSLLEVSDESSTVADAPAPAVPVEIVDEVDGMSATVADAASDVDFEVTPVHPRVEILMPGEGPSQVPLARGIEDTPIPVGAPPMASVPPARPPPPPPPPHARPPIQESPSYAGYARSPGPPPGPPPGPRPPRAGAPGEMDPPRRVLPELDYRGRVVHKNTDAGALRVGTAEKLMVLLAGIFVLGAVLAIIKIGMTEDSQRPTDPVDLDGRIVDPDAPPLAASAPPPRPAEAVVASAVIDSPAPEPAQEGPPPSAPVPAPSEPPVVPPAKPTEAPVAEPVAAAVTATGPGTLTINTYPWAKVFIDGQDLGRTPLVGHSLTAGTHQMRLVIPAVGDKVITEAVTVESGKETKIVRRVRADEPAPAPEPAPESEAAPDAPADETFE